MIKKLKEARKKTFELAKILDNIGIKNFHQMLAVIHETLTKTIENKKKRSKSD